MKEFALNIGTSETGQKLFQNATQSISKRPQLRSIRFSLAALRPSVAMAPGDLLLDATLAPHQLVGVHELFMENNNNDDDDDRVLCDLALVPRFPKKTKRGPNVSTFGSNESAHYGIRVNKSHWTGNGFSIRSKASNDGRSFR